MSLPYVPTSEYAPSPLKRIVAEFEAAGVRPTPLGILSKATDDGMSDREIGALVAELAARPDLIEVASRA